MYIAYRDKTVYLRFKYNSTRNRVHYMGREINFAISYSHQFWDRLPLIAVTAAAILVDFSSVEYWWDKLVFVHFFLKSVIDTKKAKPN